MGENPAGWLFVWGEVQEDEADANCCRNWRVRSLHVSHTMARQHTVYRRKPENDPMQGLCGQGANNT